VYRNILSLVFLAAFFSIGTANAAGPAVDDRCIVHLDKSFYINGEVIWYKIYLPEIVKNRSVALKVVLTNGAGEAQDYSFIKTGGEMHAEGYYKIPFDITPGVYHLFFQGLDDVNRVPVTLAEVPIPIYSDEQIPAAAAESTVPSGGTANVANELKVEVSLDNGSVRNREEARVQVKVTDGAGRPVQAGLSVAVTDWDLAGSEVMNLPNLQAGGMAFPSALYNLIGSVYTRSRLVSELGDPLQANVLGAYSPKENKMYYTKTNAQGEIFLEFPDFYGSRPVQFIGYDREYEHISLAPAAGPSVEKPESLVYTPGIIDYLNHSRQRKKIFQMYKSLEFSLDPEIPEQQAPLLESDLTMEVQKYQRFENLAVFFREILTPLRFRAVNDTTFAARMYNPRNNWVDNYFPGKPLFIVDGKATRNGDYIAKIPTDHIQTVEIIFEPAKLRRYFNVFGNNGVSIITTNLPEVYLPKEDEEDILRINGLQPKVAFPTFEPEQAGRHRPFFRPQLYWHPTLSTNGNGECNFSYLQSDDRSTFRIQVVAQGADGKIGTGQLIYEVK
jgi:hypothetical protein